jgi:capsular polysaccharide biosynthesis protein
LELKWYLQVLLRRWPAILILPLIVAAVAVYQDSTRTEQYSANARLSVIRLPDNQPVGDFRFDEYYNYLASEFKIDDLVETVRGNVFAEAVAARMQASGMDVGSGDVQGSLSSDRQHRILSLTVTTTDPERTLAISRAAIEELEANPETYLDVLSDGAGASVRAIQIPHGAGEDSARARLILILMVLVALGAGVLLAFVVDYLDDTLYEADAVAAELGLPVIAAVPLERHS